MVICYFFFFLFKEHLCVSLGGAVTPGVSMVKASVCRAQKGSLHLAGGSSYSSQGESQSVQIHSLPPCIQAFAVEPMAKETDTDSSAFQ